MAKNVTNVEGQITFDFSRPDFALVIPEVPKVEADKEAKETELIEEAKKGKRPDREAVREYYQALINFLSKDGKFAQVFGVYGNLRQDKHLWSPGTVKTFDDYYEGNWQKLVSKLNEAHTYRSSALVALKAKAQAVGKPITEEVLYLLEDPVENSERKYLRERAKNGLADFDRTGKVYSWGEMLRQRMARRRK